MGVQINELVSEQLLSIVRLDADWNSNPDDVSFGLELFVRSLELHLTVRSVFPALGATSYDYNFVENVAFYAFKLQCFCSQKPLHRLVGG